MKDRLEGYRDVDFLDYQPYEKVVRVFGEPGGKGVCSCITTYYPNGQLQQMLEVKGGRACGAYREYFASGQIRIEAHLMGGSPEIDETAQASWIFDGVASAWDEEGNLVAQVPYQKGELDGLYTEYHPDGTVSSSMPYVRGELEGVAERWFASGALAWQANYRGGLLDGRVVTFWSEEQLAAEESFQKGLLEEGRYYNEEGALEEEVVRGEGFCVTFDDEGHKVVHQVQSGAPSGVVKQYGERGQLLRLYRVAEGQKVGEEIYYYDPPFPTDEEIANGVASPKLSMQWHDGEIQGRVKSWYPSGQLESQREMSHNRRNGVSTAWYEDGSLMMIEEYSNDLLWKGEYYRRGSNQPVSRVVEGSGTATLFDKSGFTVRKINYVEGEPDEPS